MSRTPRGIANPLWHKLSGAERFYLKMLDLEAHGAKSLDNYQNFAKALKVCDFYVLMGDRRANQARLKTAAEFGWTEMSEGSEVRNAHALCERAHIACDVPAIIGSCSDSLRMRLQGGRREPPCSPEGAGHAVSYCDTLLSTMNIKHKGLRELFERERSARLPAHLAPRIRNILGMLEAARSSHDMDMPGFRLHPLKGRREGLWSVRVSGNWRIVFRFESGTAVDVDLIDYH